MGPISRSIQTDMKCLEYEFKKISNVVDRDLSQIKVDENKRNLVHCNNRYP